ncbi:hypothetical protein [Paenibacillus durus]|uniref:Uncharacterized protein n=1 Tax=Paenibacillus durus TaxID=44251 RepID=A0A089HI23_PAEDU|nr:hypothetical protein [Paenibacillus durus]AIQ11611.1 hypothetical protein PDUR_06355 [Paenibacillus durus]
MRKITISLISISLLLILFPISINAAPQSATDILKKKYPSEVIQIIKTTDLNYDKKSESIILTKSGNLFLVNSKGVIVLINTGIISDEGLDDPSIQVFSASKAEKHIAVAFNYFPSNTQLYVYRLKNGTLQKCLGLMGDQGVEIDNKGRIHQYWKKYRNEGGWDLAEGIFTWNAKTNKYKAAGQYVIK